MVLIQELGIVNRKKEDYSSVQLNPTIFNISSLPYLWREYIEAISNLVEFGRSQNPDVSVGPPT